MQTNLLHNNGGRVGKKKKCPEENFYYFFGVLLLGFFLVPELSLNEVHVRWYSWLKLKFEYDNTEPRDTSILFIMLCLLELFFFFCRVLLFVWWLMHLIHFQMDRFDYGVSTFCTWVNLFPWKNYCSCTCPLLNPAGV